MPDGIPVIVPEPVKVIDLPAIVAVTGGVPPIVVTEKVAVPLLLDTEVLILVIEAGAGLGAGLGAGAGRGLGAGCGAGTG